MKERGGAGGRDQRDASRGLFVETRGLCTKSNMREAPHSFLLDMGTNNRVFRGWPRETERDVEGLHVVVGRSKRLCFDIRRDAPQMINR